MLTEDYGGICPRCLYTRMKMRYSTGAGSGYYLMDACPSCGFAYAGNGFDREDRDEEVWKVILEAEKNILEHAGHPVTMEGYKALHDSQDPPEPEFWPSVFVHNDEPRYAEAVKLGDEMYGKT